MSENDTKAATSPIANGDVAGVHNGQDEVDFSMARISHKQRLEKKMSKEELDTPTPSKVSNKFLSTCNYFKTDCIKKKSIGPVWVWYKL